ncbi:MAG: hypothetical protein CW338_00735 [Clostridiales bacterium]|nr:hypothetical protein [Clostridiales bacterium]
MDLARIMVIYLALLLSCAPSAEILPVSAAVPAAPAAYETPAAPAVTASPRPVPTATPVPAVIYTSLSMNSRGDDVSRLQQRLKDLGYLTGKVDGAYGYNTKGAVETFQRNNGLTVDGVAGQRTQQILFEDRSVVYADGHRDVSPDPTPVPLPARIIIRYADQFDRVLYEEERTVFSSCTIRADSSKAPGCKLKSDPEQTVLYDNGKAYPYIVEFRYLSKDVPPTREIAVRYVTIDEKAERTVLYEQTLTLDTGTSRIVECDLSLAPGYTLISAPRLAVVVDSMANMAPGVIEFVFEKAE